MMVRGLRGATTVENDDEQAVLEATQAMVEEMAKENSVLPGGYHFGTNFDDDGYQIDFSCKSSSID